MESRRRLLSITPSPTGQNYATRRRPDAYEQIGFPAAAGMTDRARSRAAKPLLENGFLNKNIEFLTASEVPKNAVY